MMVAHVTEVCISMQKLPIDNVTMHALYSDDVQAAQTERGNITTDTGYQQEITHQIGILIHTPITMVTLVCLALCFIG